MYEHQLQFKIKTWTSYVTSNEITRVFISLLVSNQDKYTEQLWKLISKEGRYREQSEQTPTGLQAHIFSKLQPLSGTLLSFLDGRWEVCKLPLELLLLTQRSTVQLWCLKNSRKTATQIIVMLASLPLAPSVSEKKGKKHISLTIDPFDHISFSSSPYPQSTDVTRIKSLGMDTNSIEWRSSHCNPTRS